ncbi:unnamed protein product [Rotaria sordida]|uniref:Uncharacterized protein n=1 Tax=Rotaria sordida TaxID=392033 RepID=A0A819CSD0_9BILA|nr:unnamed protein product [Rotaria sordida]
MTDLDFVRSVLYSKSDLILSTPSLDSCRVNNDPIYRYAGNISTHLPKRVDYRILSYNSLENRRYHSLRMKQPVPHYVTRIYDERFGSAVSPRTEPSRTIRINKEPGYQLLVDQIPNQDQTMISQRFNKLSPFVTEHGNNPNANPILRETAV